MRQFQPAASVLTHRLPTSEDLKILLMEENMTGSGMSSVNMIVLIAFLIFVYYDVRASETNGKRTLKPFLMPLLAAYYITGVLMTGTVTDVNFLLVAGLFCGCAGDTLLEKGDRFFAFGLGAFLAGHLFYSAAYLQDILHSAIPLPYWLAILGYLVYAALIMPRLLPSVDAKMRLPVILYMAVLLAMSWFALLRAGALGGRSYLTFAGSVLFTASDTILAFHVFKGKSGKGIMETYVLGQLLIVEGMLL
ncbi:MAG: lysoplasmalogenase [Lachnospiraceae bacterium]|jgi:uncharacterized membrane protein YhhN|nr:lysoplasmalogenase [Lachnospiraceae bacterium]